MGRNKLLLRVKGRTILDWVLSALDASTVDEVIVVLGHRPDELRPIVEAHRAEVVHNPDYQRGMTSSFQAGLRRAAGEAAFLILGDQLGLMAELLHRMAAVMESDGGALIVSPVYRGRRGHPVLFGSPLFPEILGLGPDEPVRDMVLRHEGAHRLVEGDAWSVMDIDTPEEFERAKSLFEASRAGAP